MIAKYALIEPALLCFSTDSGFNERKRAQILADVEKQGFRNPISVRYDGDYKVIWGKSRAWAAQKLGHAVPAVIFEAIAGAMGEIIDDPRTLFDCTVLYKPYKALIAPKDKFWT